MQHAVRTSAARTPVNHAVEQWQGFCQRYSPETRISYAYALRQFLDYSQPSFLRDIRTIDIQVWVNSLYSQYKLSTITTRIIAIKSFCTWFSDTYNLPNPGAKVRFPPGNREESRCLTDDEYRKCLAVATNREYHLIRFLANTGLRIAEFESLTPASIRGKWLVVRGKGNKIRHIPLNEHALESLNVVMQFSKNRSIVRHHSIKLSARAGIPPFSPHSLRHFFATRLLAKGVPIHHVSKLLGHSSVVVTEQIYYHFHPEHLSGLTDCLD